MTGALRVASDYTQLALHALAHVPIDGPASLYDPRYLAWSRSTLAPSAREPIERDARVIASLYARDPSAHVLQLMPELFESIAQLRASGARDLNALDAHDVADAIVLSRVRESPTLVDLTRTTMLLAAPAYLDAWTRTLADECERSLILLTPVMDHARALHPVLASADVEIAIALGARGRAFPKRILIGAPTAHVTPHTVTILAMHEASVRGADVARGSIEERYVRSEWAALGEVAAVVSRADDALRAAHAAWLRSLDLAPLCHRAVELGLCSRAQADRLVSQSGW